MSQSAAIRRLKKEYTTLIKDPPPGAIVRSLETNFLHAHFILHGKVFYDTPYEGGVYHGVLKFPSNYPMKPPSVIMRTASGRFSPDQKICFSMSDFHPELWNPMWSIRSILTGLISFMNSEEITTGGIKAPDDHRKRLAKDSLRWCMEKDPLAMELFGDELKVMAEERQNDNAGGNGSIWPPKRPELKAEQLPKVDETPTRRRRLRTAKRLGTVGTATGVATTTETSMDLAGQEGTLTSSASTSASTSAAPGGGKNSARNKKKREKEKRKKLVKKFTTSLTEQVPKFLSAIQANLLQMDETLDVGQYRADHVCWRTESMEEYTDLVSALRASVDDYTLLVESDVGGRPIATFRMAQGIPISVGDSVMNIVEIPAPKDGSPYKSGLEHVEFVISNTAADHGNGEDGKKALTPVNDAFHAKILDAFMAKHSGISWKTKAKEKDVNPDISTKIELDDFGLCSAKFHLLPLDEVILYEKSLA